MLRNRPNTPEDMHAMEEIVVDHCLLDVMVVDETSGRTLGRPWVTMAIDQASRMVVGVHLALETPSYAAVQRCLAHAFWPKDLRGLGLKNPWPCEGIPKRVVVSSGKEFYSTSLKSAQVALGFTVNHLPLESSILAGILERSLGLKQIRVIDHHEGKTFIGEPDDCNPSRIWQTTLSEVHQIILEWIVDDYHVRFLRISLRRGWERLQQRAVARCG